MAGRHGKTLARRRRAPDMRRAARPDSIAKSYAFERNHCKKNIFFR
jgi:hypothetical protein